MSLLALCERSVRAALKRGVDGAEAFALRERGTSAELEKGTLGGADFEETSGVGIRILKGKRVGFAFATSEERVPDAVEGAVKSSKLGKSMPRFRFQGPARPTKVGGLHDPRVARLEGPDLLPYADRLLAAVTDVRKDLLVAGGAVHASMSEAAIANSEGLAVAHKETGLGASLYVVQRRDGVSTGFASANSTRADLDWEAIGAEAGTLAVDSSQPKPLAKAARLPCLVRPDAASDLFSTITLPSLYGRPAHRGESYYSRKKGRAVMHGKLSILDDPTLAGGLGSTPFDDDGAPTKPRKIVDRGVLKTFLYDRHDAAEYGQRSTSNALRVHPFDGRSYKSPPTTSALQARLVAPQQATDKLIASMDDGLVLHDLMGVHTANTVSGDFSVTASVLFRVRRGAVEGPVAPLSVSGNLHAALRKGVRVGSDVKAVGGSPAWTIPSVLFEGFSATP